MRKDQIYFEQHYEKFLKDFADFIRFPSVSADPNCLQDCQNCALFLIKHLKSIFSIDVWELPNHPPIICATNHQAGSSAPTLLLYNHYDVQPAHMEDGWLANPFILRKEGDSLIARGASDNKGQCFYTWKALEHYYHVHNQFPINITWIIEGEEESDSPALKALIQEKKESVKADYFLIIDGGFSSPKSPAISLGARGIVSMKISLEEGDKDMHSGIFGGIAYNVNRALTKLLASLHNEDHSIAVPGFYDDLALPESSEYLPKENLLETGEKQFGFRPTLYAPAKTVEEAISIYPTLEINGISGGYTGEGFKTVIPHKATAYLSCRLVPNQSPKKIANLIIEHLKNQVPQSLKFSYQIGEGSPGWRSSPSSPLIPILQEIYSDLFQSSCPGVFMEASIPIAPLLGNVSEADPIICGTSFLSDAIHAAEENFSIQQMKIGFLSIYRTLEKLEEIKKAL